MSIWSSIRLIYDMEEVSAKDIGDQEMTLGVSIAYGNEIRLALRGYGIIDVDAMMDRVNVDRLIAQLTKARETMDE